jgi:hypothetical protein
VTVSKPTLFATATSSLVLGDASYLVNYSKCIGEALKVANIEAARDEVGDVYFNVTITTNVEPAPLASVYFCTTSQEHGFDYWSNIGSGHNKFFSNSWICHPLGKTFLAFEGIRTQFTHAAEFLKFSYEGVALPYSAVELVIHTPDPGFLKQLTSPNSGHKDELAKKAVEMYMIPATERLGAVLRLTQYCEFVSVWHRAPLRPVIISQHIENILGKLSQWCEEDGVSFRRTTSEADFPSW